MIQRVLCCCIIILIVPACRERFEAEGLFKSTNFLVVEGFINVGEGITRIKLSRVSGLMESVELISENNAQVFIENNNGTVYSLYNRNNGLYESDELGLDASHEYRLKIETESKVYFSSYTTPILSPLIDSVGWIKGDDKTIAIHVNTHDPHSETYYYKWEYEEVWEVRSTFQSSWAYENGTPRARSADEINLMSYCWPYNYNSDLLFASSAQLTTDAIRLFPLKKINVSGPQFGWRYSITVMQRALTLSEYEFLQIMKKNTNDLGSFFDVQPSQLAGNMYCANSEEPIIGYIGSYSSNQKQLIIRRDQISDFDYVTPCFFDPATALMDEEVFQEYVGAWLPLEPIYGPFVDNDAAPIIGFSFAQKECADCRVLSGNALKPDFWVAEDQGDVE